MGATFHQAVGFAGREGWHSAGLHFWGDVHASQYQFDGQPVPEGAAATAIELSEGGDFFALVGPSGCALVVEGYQLARAPRVAGDVPRQLGKLEGFQLVWQPLSDRLGGWFEQQLSCE
ncbi:hypothetical protein ACRQ5Q_25730 [Bradyrhizobium sp. PMVTL-01]|uniref:hypothetical protein n=1 Tax=unclassified Bradyrhizobium TaxID=2631580 RepID=UPI003F70F093